MTRRIVRFVGFCLDYPNPELGFWEPANQDVPKQVGGDLGRRPREEAAGEDQIDPRSQSRSAFCVCILFSA